VIMNGNSEKISHMTILKGVYIRKMKWVILIECWTLSVDLCILDTNNVSVVGSTSVFRSLSL
jgi:hypothetical protein